MSWKLSRTVLRGAVGGNADCLLDPKEGHTISPTYTPEPAADEAPMGTVDLFGTLAPTKKTKPTKLRTGAT